MRLVRGGPKDYELFPADGTGAQIIGATALTTFPGALSPVSCTPASLFPMTANSDR